MSITVVKDKGVTVVTMTTDSKNMLPPLCQILKTLCYSPMCCSVYKGADGLMQTSTVSALGTIQIMVGLFNIGLGPGRTSLHPGDFAHLGVAYWLGGVFIAAGITSLLVDRFPSTFLVGFALMMNVVGSIVAIVGIVLYDMSIVTEAGDSFCYNARGYEYNCRFVAGCFMRLLTVMDNTLIILAVLQLCVCICITLMGISVLVNLRKEKGGRDEELYQPLLKDVLMTSPGA